MGGAKKPGLPSSTLQKVPGFVLLACLALLLISIVLWIETSYRKKNLDVAIKEYKQAWELSKKIDVLKKEQKSLHGEVEILEGQLKRDFSWPKKLKHLSELVPKEVWLKQLFFEKKAFKDTHVSILTLKGGLIPQENSNPLATLTSFVNKLKADKFFSVDFENPVLSDFHSEVYKNIDITAFLIEMPLKLKGK
jgi:Tfp pilus assembly protein PilN